MVSARLSTWTFKKGKEEMGFLELDNALTSSVRLAKGFRGYLSMFSTEASNTAVILTVWQDEEALNASAKEVFVGLMEKIQNLLEKPPTSENFKVFSTELFQRQEE
jgi:quinol monooxygenase YgiN